MRGALLLSTVLMVAQCVFMAGRGPAVAQTEFTFLQFPNHDERMTGADYVQHLSSVNASELVSGKELTDFVAQKKREDWDEADGARQSVWWLWQGQGATVVATLTSGGGRWSCERGPLNRAPLSGLPNSTLLGTDFLPLFGEAQHWTGAYGGYHYDLWTRSDFTPIVFSVSSAYVRVYFAQRSSAKQDILSQEVFVPPC